MFLILLDIANALVEEGIHETPVFNELSYFFGNVFQGLHYKVEEFNGD